MALNPRSRASRLAFPSGAWERGIHMRWLFLTLAALGIAAVIWLGLRRETTPPDGAPATTPTRPSVVLISLDTLRADHLGCYGYGRNTSPNLDRFAQASSRFTQCRAQATWTLPSHMSLFTSMLPSDNGVDNLNKVLPESIPT